MKILVYGYGNPGRQDDGLGILLAEAIEELEIEGVTIDSNYQLNAEDAVAVSESDLVFFIDASKNDIAPFSAYPLKPEVEVSFTTHAMSPGSVLALSKELYNKCPDTYMLEIKGYEWAMQEGLSNQASKNLKKAYEYLKDIILLDDLMAIKNSIKSKKPCLSEN